MAITKRASKNPGCDVALHVTNRIILNFRMLSSETCLNRTLSKSKTCLNQTDFTKCLCNLNLCKPNTCLNWTNSSVPKGFGLDRSYCITFQSDTTDNKYLIYKFWLINYKKVMLYGLLLIQYTLVPRKHKTASLSSSFLIQFLSLISLIQVSGDRV